MWAFEAPAKAGCDYQQFSTNHTSRRRVKNRKGARQLLAVMEVTLGLAFGSASAKNAVTGWHTDVESALPGSVHGECSQ